MPTLLMPTLLSGTRTRAGHPGGGCALHRETTRQRARAYSNWLTKFETEAEKLAADDPVQLFPSERPQYAALHAAVTRAWRATQAAFGELRERWYEIIGQDDPAKVSPIQASRLQRAAARGAFFALKAEPLSEAAQAELDAAIEVFLRTFAGADRSEADFVSPGEEDGILQQAGYLAYQVGVQQGQTFFPDQPNLVFTVQQQARLNAEAFARLTQDGRFRFEQRLDEIKQAMLDGFERGDNPLTIARQLGRDLSGYEAGRLRTIVRTEMALASEAGIHDLYAEAGVEWVEVIGDPNTDALCMAHRGRVYQLGDDENLPIYHPNCYCSVIPAEDPQATREREREPLFEEDGARPIGPPPDDVREAPSTTAHLEPTEFAQRVRARIAQGATTEADLSQIGELVRQEIVTRLAELRGITAEATGPYASEYRRLELRDVLAELRAMGGEVTQPWVGETREAIAELLPDLYAFLPTEWLERSAAGPEMVQLIAPPDQAGGYDPRKKPRPFIVSFRGQPGDRDLLRRSIFHEFGHRLEEVVPRIRELELAFYNRRTADEPEVPLSIIEPDVRIKRGGWLSDYMGRVPYSSGSTEILTYGLECLFDGKYNLLDDDPDYARFILGMMAAL